MVSQHVFHSTVVPKFPKFGDEINLETANNSIYALATSRGPTQVHLKLTPP